MTEYLAELTLTILSNTNIKSDFELFRIKIHKN